MKQEYKKPQIEEITFGLCNNLLQSSEYLDFPGDSDDPPSATGEIGFNQTFADKVSPKV